MTDQQATIILQPAEGALDFPPSSVTSQLTTILPPPPSAPSAMRNQQFYSASLQAVAQGVTIISAVGDHATRLTARPTSAPAGAFTCARVLSVRLTSASEALANCAPSGMP
jgi:hypothetical protein